MNTTLLAFSLGPPEILGLLVLMVFLFGPKRIPEIGESVGKAISSFKKATRDAEKEIADEQGKLSEKNAPSEQA